MGYKCQDGLVGFPLKVINDTWRNRHAEHLQHDGLGGVHQVVRAIHRRHELDVICPSGQCMLPGKPDLCHRERQADVVVNPHETCRGVSPREAQEAIG